MSQELERRMKGGHRSMLVMKAFVAPWAVIQAFAAQTFAERSPYPIVFVRHLVHVLSMAALSLLPSLTVEESA